MNSNSLVDSNPLLLSPIKDLAKLLEICINRLNDAIVITEADAINVPGPRIIWANKVFFERNGYSPDEIIGQSPRILQGPETDRAVLHRVRTALESWQSVRAEVLNYRKDGSSYWNEFEIVPIANEKGVYTHFVSVQRDVTERKLLEMKFKELSSIDYLTEVFNRRSFMDKMEHEFALLQRGYYAQLAVLMLDIDFFKHVNDTFGHAAGDMVLKHLASLLRNNLRRIDTVGRLGGEEFAIILPNLNIGAAKVFADRLRVNIMDSVAEYNGKFLPVTVSIGISVIEDISVTTEAALIQADKELYRAKQEGRNRTCP
ncbi:MAG: diguanylate cyclase [Proteobacteria bacterium]|nr:diguanylate cyclase [Pseudomonadota bacterium]